MAAEDEAPKEKPPLAFETPKVGVDVPKLIPADTNGKAVEDPGKTEVALGKAAGEPMPAPLPKDIELVPAGEAAADEAPKEKPPLAFETPKVGVDVPKLIPADPNGKAVEDPGKAEVALGKTAE